MSEVESRANDLEAALTKLVYAQFNIEIALRQFVRKTEVFQDEMKEFKDEMKTFKDETQAIHKEMNKRWGELANKMGTVVNQSRSMEKGRKRPVLLQFSLSGTG